MKQLGSKGCTVGKHTPLVGHKKEEFHAASSVEKDLIIDALAAVFRGIKELNKLVDEKSEAAIVVGGCKAMVASIRSLQEQSKAFDSVIEAVDKFRLAASNIVRAGEIRYL
jgi:hypothetical protein